MPLMRDAVIYVEDLVSAATIKIDEDQDGDFSDETALAASDYELIPRSAPYGSEPRPYTAIELTTWGTKGCFVPGARVEVTGVHGWPSVPAAIKRACIQLTAILRLDSPRAQRQVTDLGQVVEMSPQGAGIVRDLIREGYRRVVI